ncbi:aromatic-ring hydroxylase C-terminal domain-containing protein [Streptomyces sp. EMB24]|uniref:aromatic-ring hydroxylase C-terminal domain-containing protein n=1 Tax=Streptomyces sp. EMB24 TaxID=2835531 RepID=UPI003FA37E0E
MDGTRLFDAFRGPHRTPRALGAAAPNRPRAYGSCAARPTGRTYGTGLFLVRPDGYVGWTGDTPDGLGAYLARFGTR